MAARQAWRPAVLNPATGHVRPLPRCSRGMGWRQAWEAAQNLAPLHGGTAWVLPAHPARKARGR